MATDGPTEEEHPPNEPGVGKAQPEAGVEETTTMERGQPVNQ